jgi:SRSO17 transposase
MERRFEVRKQEILKETEIQPQVANGMLKRLEQFAQPFIASFGRREPKENAQRYLGGLLSDLGRKNIESIAYRYDQDRQALQKFIGTAHWDHQPLQQELARQIGLEIGQEDGVIVFDPSGHKKGGRDSVGVQRQWLGRLGKVDNGQVGVYMGYASGKEHALVDQRLYLSKEWAKDKVRRKKCGVPKEIRYQTRHELALDMLKNNGEYLPHRWTTGDDEMGRSSGFRRDLRDLGEQYLLDVPSNTLIRDLDVEPPAYGGQGRMPKQPFQRVDRWRDSLEDKVWTKIDVRDGEKGPLVIEIVTCRVMARTERSRHHLTEELLIVTRRPEGRNQVKYDYHLSNAPADTPLDELARVVKAEHRIEDCLKRAKSEAGLSDYEVRTWTGWHHHQTLSLIALWFLILETGRGKKIYPSSDGSPGSDYIVRAVASSLRPPTPRLGETLYQTKKQTQRACSVLSLQAT